MILRSLMNQGSPRFAALLAVFGVASVFGAGIANAAEPNPAIHETYQLHQAVVQELVRGNVAAPATAAIQNLVGQGLQALRDSGEQETADRLEAEWKQHYEHPLTQADFVYSSSMGVLDLGDHPPLSLWLAKFHDTLSDRTRGVIRAFRMVEDINTLNYALAVVFAPRGKWRAGKIKADSIEYRKHFIPFANIVTYWLTYEGCKAACKKFLHVPGITLVCNPAATKLEKYMGRYVAWRISDWIFNKANHVRGTSAVMTLADLPMMSEEELENEVMSDLSAAGELQ